MCTVDGGKYELISALTSCRSFGRCCRQTTCSIKSDALKILVIPVMWIFLILRRQDKLVMCNAFALDSLNISLVI